MRHRYNLHPLVPTSFRHYPTISEILTELTELPIGDWLREHAIVQQLEQIPFARTPLSLEVPEDPTPRLRLESFKLCLNVLAHFVLPGVAPVLDLSTEIRIAAPTPSHPPAIGKCTLVTISSFEAIEMGSAIGHCARPFANDHPFV